jgi:hypothetical protein
MSVERAFAFAQARDRVMMRYVSVGSSVLAGVALFEVALIPAVAIGRSQMPNFSVSTDPIHTWSHVFTPKHQ